MLVNHDTLTFCAVHARSCRECVHAPPCAHAVLTHASLVCACMRWLRSRAPPCPRICSHAVGHTLSRHSMCEGNREASRGRRLAQRSPSLAVLERLLPPGAAGFAAERAHARRSTPTHFAHLMYRQPPLGRRRRESLADHAPPPPQRPQPRPQSPLAAAFSTPQQPVAKKKLLFALLEMHLGGRRQGGARSSAACACCCHCSRRSDAASASLQKVLRVRRVRRVGVDAYERPARALFLLEST
eukprot:364378-Chlamydomonas_euryale.AAC.3